MAGNRDSSDIAGTGTETVARFDIQYTRRLAPDGSLTGDLPDFARDSDKLLHLYREMVRVRTFDNRAIALQRTGQLGTYGSSLGQEAIGVAIGDALRREDVLLPSYREYAAQLMRGVAVHELLLYWGGDERGMCFANAREDFPITIPIASNAPQAAGVAFAFKYRKQPRVALCVLGDGGSSKGDFYEAINVAGAWQLPVLFLVVNNQWAISVPRRAQTAAGTLAQKGLAGGLPSEQVDGNDLIALRERLGAAVEQTRNGGGPALIEALTYRLSDHTTADDASRYRTEEDVKSRWEEDPLRRLRVYLEQQKLWDKTRDEEWQAQCKAEIEEEVKRYLETPAPPATAMFDYLYGKLPAALETQRDEVAARSGQGEESGGKNNG